MSMEVKIRRLCVGLLVVACWLFGQSVNAMTASGVQTPEGPKVVLMWDSNTEPDISGYRMYRSETQGTGYVVVSGGQLIPHTGDGTESWTDETVQYGKTYYWVVTALNTSGLESGYSNEVSLFIANPNPPSAPSGLRVSGRGEIARIQWNPMEGATGYEVYRVQMNLDGKQVGQWKMLTRTTKTQYLDKASWPRKYSVRAVLEKYSDYAVVPYVPEPSSFSRRLVP